ncbi:MAG TPA: 16S rRNA (cytosine(1402)-N(4))-methyltransferase [Ruminococcaceae bacterium]|nr:16S rRNA (cytosine(1402)-N(4))-methyltransferase [Oscillospiraceae bacterium]
MGEFKHISVLLQESIDALNIKPDGIYVDGTAGGAGHSREIAKRLTSGRLLALDKDPQAVAVATQRLKEYPNATVIHSDFSRLCEVLDEQKIDGVDGILLDLGVSSYQLDEAQRGFSYHADAKLDMRMSMEGTSAYDIVNNCSVDELARILREYGEEKFAYKIACQIEKHRKIQPIETTTQLSQIINQSFPPKMRWEGKNPSKRSFQAIRIAVNSELDCLSQVLDTAFDRLNPGGRFAIITFHSLEDRMVKQKFAALAKGCICPPDFPVCVCGHHPQGVLKKPIEPSEKELEENPRSHSARLRVIEKL